MQGQDKILSTSTKYGAVPAGVNSPIPAEISNARTYAARPFNMAVRYFIEYFMRDAYAYYGYGFLCYGGEMVDEARVDALVEGFTTLNGYIYKTWKRVFDRAEATQNGQRVEEELEKQLQKELLDKRMRNFEKNRKRTASILLEGLRFVNKNGQPLHMIPRLELDPALLEQPLYH